MAERREHDCLRDRVPGEQHCIICHATGHTYEAHLGLLGLAPHIVFEMRVPASPVHSTGDPES